MKKTVSVVIVTYNSSRLIKRCLLSLINFSNMIETIVIVDNNSNDFNDTQTIIKQIKKETKPIRIKLIRNINNVGFAKASNQGALAVSTEYILFVNPDTIMKSTAIPTLVKHAEMSRADIVGGMIRNKDNQIQNSKVRSPNIGTAIFEFSNFGKAFKLSDWHKHLYYLDKKPTKNNFGDETVDAVSGAYMLIKRKSFILLSGFDERFFMYLEDIDIGVRAKKLSMKVIYCPHSEVFHEQGASSKNKYRINQRAWYESRKQYFLKHHGITANIFAQIAFFIDEIFTTLFRGRN